MEGNTDHLDAAALAIQQKKPIPEIDFSLHKMEDGTQVSTQERVCKGMLRLSHIGALCLLYLRLRGASAGVSSTDRRPLPFST